MPTARGRQASKNKAKAKRRPRRKAAVVPDVPVEEVIRVVPLADPAILVEAPVAPEPPRLTPTRATRAAGVARIPELWTEMERNRVVNEICLRLDRNIERVDSTENRIKNLFFSTLLIGFIFVLCSCVLISINRNEIAEQAKQLKNAEHKIKILMATAAEKEPTPVPSFPTPVPSFVVNSNGNTIFFGKGTE